MQEVRVAVLGCGPAGLLAAHGAVRAGAEVQVFSMPKRSVIGGAQYIHFAIPGVTKEEPDGTVQYLQHGSRAGYAIKVYGNAEQEVSWDNYPPGFYEIWNMSRVYDQLWVEYGGWVHPVHADSEVLDNLSQKFDLVINSVPRTAVCYGPSHEFHHQRVWIDYRRGNPLNPNIIIYSGEGSVDWYRWSCLFGFTSAEYSFEPSNVAGLIEVKKPLKTNCRCWEDTANVLPVGRYGQWSKRALAHEAYFETYSRVLSMR